MSFAGDIKRFSDKANIKFDLVYRGTVLSMFSKIVQRTPIDTGRLRGNWQIGISSRPTGELSRKGISGAIGGEQRKISRIHGGDVVYITNNLPYAQVIENGSSEQAPNGMLRITVEEYKSIVAEKASGA